MSANSALPQVFGGGGDTYTMVMMTILLLLGLFKAWIRNTRLALCIVVLLCFDGSPG